MSGNEHSMTARQVATAVDRLAAMYAQERRTPFFNGWLTALNLQGVVENLEEAGKL